MRSHFMISCQADWGDRFFLIVGNVPKNSHLASRKISCNDKSSNPILELSFLNHSSKSLGFLHQYIALDVVGIIITHFRKGYKKKLRSKGESVLLLSNRISTSHTAQRKPFDVIALKHKSWPSLTSRTLLLVDRGGECFNDFVEWTTRSCDDDPSRFFKWLFHGKRRSVTPITYTIHCD